MMPPTTVSAMANTTSNNVARDINRRAAVMKPSRTPVAIETPGWAPEAAPAELIVHL
jgi:hypothetical protein